MYKIIDKKDSGKTHNLMEMAKKEDGIIVCSNPSAMQNKARNYGIVGLNFISYSEYLQDMLKYPCIFIDDLDNMIAQMTNVKGYTFNVEG